MQSSSYILWCLLREVENVCWYSNLQVDVYGSFSHITSLQATKMSFSRWVDK